MVSTICQGSRPSMRMKATMNSGIVMTPITDMPP